MESNYFLGSKFQTIQNSGVGTLPANNQLGFGRVDTIVLDDTVQIVDGNGVLLPIGGIRYKLITQGVDSDENLGYALPLFANIQQYPVVNEIVILIDSPEPNSQVIDQNQTKYYINLGAVNAWGTPHHNAVPQQDVDYNNPIGQGVKELSDINPLYPYPGDTIVQGRLGQSIRLSGYKSKYNPMTDDSNDAKPFILISNGQIKTDNGIDPIIEDINRDDNSMYFLSDQKVPLTAANNKRASYDVAPIRSSDYIGNQVIINGGRLYFNAKNDSALISAKDSIGLNANTLNFDAQEYTCIDAKRIYLGSGARASVMREPAVLGIQLENWLITLLDSLESVAVAMTSAAITDVDDSGAPITRPVMSVATVGPELEAAVKSLKTQIGLFQSKKVFTE